MNVPSAGYILKHRQDGCHVTAPAQGIIDDAFVNVCGRPRSTWVNDLIPYRHFKLLTKHSMVARVGAEGFCPDPYDDDWWWLIKNDIWLLKKCRFSNVWQVKGQENVHEAFSSDDWQAILKAHDDGVRSIVTSQCTSPWEIAPACCHFPPVVKEPEQTPLIL